MWLRIGGIVTLIMLGGCGPLDRLALRDQGAQPVVDGNHTVDLVHALDPNGLAAPNKAAAPNSGATSSDEETFAEAFTAFNKPLVDSNGTDPVVVSRLTLLRNQIQDQLIDTSRSNCSSFKQRLNASQSLWNLMFGTVTTSLAGAGAVVTGVAAQALSASAGVTSGVRAEFNESLFREKVAEVLTKAIETRRDSDMIAIKKAQASDIKAYTMEAAVSDAILFNDHCSLISAFEVVNQSIAVADDPGLKRLATLFKGTKVDTALGGIFTNVATATDPNSVIPPAGGTPGAGSGAGSQPVMDLVTLQQQVKSYQADITAFLAGSASAAAKATVTSDQAALNAAFQKILSSIDTQLAAYITYNKQLAAATTDDTKNVATAQINVVIATTAQLKNAFTTAITPIDTIVHPAAKS